MGEAPGGDAGGLRTPAEVTHLWPEVALHADEAAHDVLVLRSVETGRPGAAAAEIEQHPGRVHVLIDPRPHDFGTDLEVLHRVPDGAGTDRPELEFVVAAGHRPTPDRVGGVVRRRDRSADRAHDPDRAV